jgi:hypothetical protein
MCQEDKYPGLWQRWFKNQCVSVGWPSNQGYKLDGKTKKGDGWIPARNAIKEMMVGDKILVTLKNNRIARLAEIVRKEIGDNQWEPLVHPELCPPLGNQGRRILVRWDLATGPGDPDMVVQIPKEYKFTNGELQGTIRRIGSLKVGQVRSIMSNPCNWVGLWSKFGKEKALSDYIATFPHHLEDGLSPHPNVKIREKIFKDKKRADVLLLDYDKKRPVIVECKQHAASVAHIEQLRGYVRNLAKETKQSIEKVRGILVHAGTQKLAANVIREAKKKPVIEIVCYRLRVEFTR